MLRTTLFRIPAFTMILAALFLFGSKAKAASPEQNGTDSLFSNDLDSFYMVMKVIGVLVILIVIFLILIRLLARRQRGIGFNRPLRSMGGVPLGQNKSLQLVSIGKTIYVVGVGENVQLLDKIEDEATVNELTELMTNAVPAEFPPVGTWLKQLRQRQKPIEEEELSSSSFGQMFQDKLQQISNSKKRTQDLLQRSDEDRFDPQ